MQPSTRTSALARFFSRVRRDERVLASQEGGGKEDKYDARIPAV